MGVPRLYTSVLIAALCSHLFAQTDPCDLVLSGRVLDEHDRTPLSFADLVVGDGRKGATADAQGRFRIEGLCPGALRLRVTHVGCEMQEIQVEIRTDREITVFLEHHIHELEQFEVARERPDENVGHSRVEVDREQMDRSTGRSIAEMLNGITGVDMQQSGPTISKPVIRGLSGNRVLLLNQGIRQEDQQWGTEHAPNLDPFSTDRITVVRGAASVQYGSDALGGVIVTEPVELPDKEPLRGEIRALGMLNGRGGGGIGLLEGAVRRVPGLAWRVQGSGKYLGDAQAPDYVLSNTGLRESGASATLAWERHLFGATVYYSWFARELGILRASHIGNLTDLQNAVASGEVAYEAPFNYAIDAPRQTVHHHLLKAEAYWRPSELDQLVLTYSYQANDRQEYDRRRGGRSAIPALDLFLATHTVDLVYKHFLGEQIHGKVGVNGLWQENFNVPGTGVRPLLPNYDRGTIGLFMVEHFPISDELELEAGARLDQAELRVRTFDVEDTYITPSHSFTNHAFSLGTNWSVTDSIRVRAGVNSAFRPPHVSELYSQGLHHGSAAIEEGDPDLDSERMVQATIDTEWDARNGRWSLDWSLHASRTDGFIYLRPEGYRLTIRGAFPVFRYTATDVFMWGTDARVAFRPARAWELSVQGGLVRGRDLQNDEWLFQVPADRIGASAAWQTAVGKGHLRLSVDGRWVRVQDRIPVGLDFTGPPDGYTLLGMDLLWERPLGRDRFQLGLRAENLLNTAYRDYLDRFRYYADARGMDITVWFSWRFGAAQEPVRPLIE
ncbi:MAG: TonB-dependent receptor [Flavobacteriales bacterium]|nr:TonB-dependent receptor [Flavobacteriales bacterium]